MAESTDNLRVTTISLDEYNALKIEADRLKGLNGGQSTTINILNDKIYELEQKQPLVKVLHYHMQEDWDESPYPVTDKVEFVNLTEVERLAEEKAKSTVKDKLEVLENKVDNTMDELKRQRINNELLADKLDEKERLVKKVKTSHATELETEKETYTKNIDKLKKAAKEDAESYKETISELKDEIKKIKDNKTDAEVEEKRNKEIKDLKGRIKDLEKTIEELGSMNFFKRVFKLRTISAEKLAAQSELLEREKNANAVGTTWVKENNKYRPYDKFSSVWEYLSQQGRRLQSYTYGVYDMMNGAYTTVASW